MSFEPATNSEVFVSGVVVGYQVNVEAVRSLLVDLSQKPDPFLMPVARHAVGDNFALQHFDSRKQGRRAVSLVVMGHRPTTAPFDVEARLGAVERLDLGLFVDAENKSMLGRIEIEAHYVDDLFLELRVSTELERANAMRLQSVSFPYPMNEH